MDIRAVRNRLEHRIAEAGTARDWARKHGIEEATLSKVRCGFRRPNEKLLAALDLKLDYVEIRT